MRGLVLAGLLACSVVSTPIHAQNLKSAPTVFTAGKWKVVRSIDRMTDKVSCTGIYNEEYGVQLTDSRLFVSFSGGIDGVTLRFDDRPPNPLRLATEMEKKIRSLVISDRDFVDALKATRLRIEVSTLVSGIKFQEVDTTDMMAAVDNIKAGCPAQSDASQAPPTKKALESGGPECNRETINRMKNAKIADAQIQAVCGSL